METAILQGAATRARSKHTDMVRQVFTRWPEASGWSPAPKRDLPHWVEGYDRDARKETSFRLVPLVVAIGVVAVASLAWSRGGSLTLAAAGVVCLLVALTVYALERSNARLAQALASERAWVQLAFDRAGVPMWREDWTAARDKVADLMKAGVRDMEAYFAAHPDEARALRRQIIIKDVNELAVQRLGAKSKEELLGPLDNILPDTDQTFVQWLIAFERGDEMYRSETHLTRSDGSEAYTLFMATLPRSREEFENIVVVDLDITEAKAAQERLAAAELELANASRLTAVGALSASIAHEVNTPLSAILSHAEAGLRWLNREEPDLCEAQQAIKHVIADTRRARDVVDRTRAFLSNRPASMLPFDVGQVAREAVILIERELRACGASVHMNVIDGVPKALGDPLNVQQVIVNLLLNGAQAMEARPAPRDLVVSIERHDANTVRVDVRDSGPGIAPDEQNLIFDPFYSTKANGMGLGLAICRTCIAAHGGKLWVKSEPGKGAAFCFTLPLAGAPVERRGGLDNLN